MDETGIEHTARTIDAEIIKEVFIEEHAWNVFQNKLNITFKNEISEEERKQITDVPEYEHYRKIAEKVWEKKQRALDNKKYPVIEIPADGNSGMWGGAYCLCFVYSKHRGNVVLKGYMREVEEYLHKNFTHYFCNFSLWHRGMNRDIWEFWKNGVGISTPSRYRKRTPKDELRFQVYPRSDSFKYDEGVERKRKAETLYFKRMPKRWIPEFDKF